MISLNSVHITWPLRVLYKRNSVWNVCILGQKRCVYVICKCLWSLGASLACIRHHHLIIHHNAPDRPIVYVGVCASIALSGSVNADQIYIQLSWCYAVISKSMRVTQDNGGAIVSRTRPLWRLQTITQDYNGTNILNMIKCCCILILKNQLIHQWHYLFPTFLWVAFSIRHI